VIGASKCLRVPNRCLWLGTGNNPSLSDELARRTVFIHLDAQSEHPDLGRTFRHPALKVWAAQEREALVRSLLIIVQAWVQRGMPVGDVTFGGFESWAQYIGGILSVADVEGFLVGVEASRAKSDGETVAFRGFVESWAAKWGESDVSARDLLGCAGVLDLGQGGNHSRVIKLGFVLSGHADQRFGQWQVRKKPTLRNGYQLWRLQKGGEDGGSGSSGYPTSHTTISSPL
jgi:hypothetical protein